MESNTARMVFTICAVILLGIIVGFIIYDKGLNIDFKSLVYERNIRQ